MKRILIMCVVALAMVSCGIGDENSSTGRAALVVKLGKVVIYSDSDVEWRIEQNLASVIPAQYDLFMDGTRFVSLMPMLDMEVTGMENQHSQPDQHFLYEAESVVPSIKGNPMPKYTLSNFRCEVVDWEILKVSFSCKGYDATYEKSLSD